MALTLPGVLSPELPVPGHDAPAKPVPPNTHVKAEAIAPVVTAQPAPKAAPNPATAETIATAVPNPAAAEMIPAAVSAPAAASGPAKQTLLATLPPLPRQRPPARSPVPHETLLAQLAAPVATALSQPANQAPTSNSAANPVSDQAGSTPWRPALAWGGGGTASRGFGTPALAGLDELFGGRVGTGVAGTIGASSLAESPAGLEEALGAGEFFGGRIRVDFSDAGAGEFVQEIVGANGVMMTDLSEADAYWRRETKVEVDVLRSQGASLSFAGSYTDERTPDTGGRSLFNMGGVTGWSESSSQEFGAKLGLFGDRLTYSGGLAFSSSDGALYSDDSDEEGGARSGGAQWHRVDAKVLDGETIGLKIHGLYGIADEEFSSGGEASEAGLDQSGETQAFGAELDIGSFGLSYSHTANSVEGQTETLSGRINLGLADLTLTRSLKTSFDQESANWSSRRLTHGADLSFDLEEYRGLGEGEGFDATSLVPSSVTFGASLGEVDWAAGGPSDLEQGVGFGLEWYGESSSTSIDVWRDFTDSRAVGLESADDEYWTVDVSQDFYGQAWDVSLYLSFTQDTYMETGASSLERDVSGGVSFSYYADDLPDASLSFDLGGYEWSEADYASADTFMEVGASLDFSKFLPTTDGDFEPYLKLNYYAQQVTTEDSDAGATNEWGHAAMVKAGFQF